AYTKDDLVKVAKYRQAYSGIKGSTADNLVERAIWYMDNGYMVYGHQYKGYKDYGIVDCSNFVSLVYSDLGLDITTTAKKYGSVGTRVQGVYSKQVNGKWTIQGTENLKPGDVFTWYAKTQSGSKYISHVAIYIGMIDGQPAVIGTADAGNPTAIGIVNDWRYWWGEKFFTVQRILPAGSWTAGQGIQPKAPTIPAHYQLPPQRPVPEWAPVKTPVKTAPQTNSYIVKTGDMLWKIAVTHNTTVEQITTLNNITNANLIYPGQVLKLPV
ncbi:MAG: LysM peptidoglycan-binding domain-containing protein, partial [Heliobacteriaceae bacterium]|nr:LysM peptidoglycan-binding domain-containing protein [Heliobacteriaceae bacterium]